MNLINSLKEKKLKITENKKIFFTIVAGVVVIALLMGSILAAFGHGFFNSTVEMGGGYKMSLTLGTRLTDDTYEEFVDEIKDVTKNLGGYGLKVSRVDRIGRDSGAGVIISYKAVANEQEMATINAELKQALEKAMFNSVNVYAKQVSEASLVEGYATIKNLMHTILATTLLAIFAFVFYAIRYNIQFALLAVLDLLLNIIILGSLMAMLRIPMDTSFVPALLITLSASTINTLILFSCIKEALKRKSQETPTVIANEAVEHNLLGICLMGAAALILALPLAIALIIADYFSLAIFIGVAVLGICVSCFCSMCITPSIWALFRNNELRKGLGRRKRS